MRSSRYWLVVIGLAVLVPAAVAVVDASLGADRQEVFCSAEGLIGPDGEVYGRSASRGCQFVDGEGDLLRQTSDGEPLCYRGHEDRVVVPCGQPDAVRPG